MRTILTFAGLVLRNSSTCASLMPITTIFFDCAAAVAAASRVNSKSVRILMVPPFPFVVESKTGYTMPACRAAVLPSMRRSPR